MRLLWLSLLFTLSLFSDAHIFVLHRFDDVRYPSTSTSTNDLRDFFEYLKKNEYKVITLSRLSDALKEKQSIDPKWIVFTIDDTFKSFYNNALELFKEYKYPFTLFVYAQAAQKNYGDYMSWQELQESAQYGEIGAHSYAHNHLVSLSAQEIMKDTNKTMQLLKKYNLEAKAYAYPYGEYDQKVFNAISSFGFDTILNQNSGAVSEKSSRFDLDRIALTGTIDTNHALHYKYLQAKWLLPLNYPEDEILKDIEIEVEKEIKDIELYVSGHGWQKVKVKEGIIKLLFDKKLKSKRVRIIIKTADNRYSSKIIVKE